MHARSKTTPSSSTLTSSSMTHPSPVLQHPGPWAPGNGRARKRSGICFVSQARIAVLDVLHGFVLQGADHRLGGGAWVGGGDRADLAAQPVSLVADGDPADAVRHGRGGDARDQGDAESGADQSQAGGPVMDGERHLWLGDAWPGAELG